MGRAGRVVEVCLSQGKGGPKRPVGAGRLVEDYGLEGDGHAGTERQVSILCQRSADKVRAAGLEVGPGDFAENLLVDGLGPADFVPGARVHLRPRDGRDGPLLEVTQIGKECHTGCAIREAVGDCVMPREGIFARVLRGGPVARGDAVEVARPRDEHDDATRAAEHCDNV